MNDGSTTATTENKMKCASMLLAMEKMIVRYEQNRAGHDDNFCQSQIAFHKARAARYIADLKDLMPDDEFDMLLGAIRAEAQKVAD